MNRTFGKLLLAVSLCVFLIGCVRIYDESGNEMIFSSTQLSGQEAGLFAQVKGSIYGAGEFVSVFGNCLDVNDAGVVGSYGELSAWYPNGTQLFVNTPMQELQTGYFLYNGYMDPVQGTYLTEFTCRVNGSNQVAVAFGEWQNPYWVTRIANAESFSNLSVTLVNQALSLLAQVNQTLYVQNELLFSSLNQTMLALSQQLSGVYQNLSSQIGDSFSVVLQNNALLNQLCYGNSTGVQINFLNVTSLSECPVLSGLQNLSVQSCQNQSYQLQLAIDLLNAICFANTTGVSISFNVTPQLYECTTLQNIQSSLDAIQLQISLLNDSVVAGFNQTYVLIESLNQTFSSGFNQTLVVIGELNSSITQGFNQTFVMINQTNSFINQTFVNLSEQIQYVAVVANASVDRNDSYLAGLLNWILVNGTPSTGPAGGLNFTEQTSRVIFHGVWQINVTVKLGDTQVGSDYVSCFINTTNSPATVGARMEPISGPQFTYSETIKKLYDFDWDVWCVRNA